MGIDCFCPWLNISSCWSVFMNVPGSWAHAASTGYKLVCVLGNMSVVCDCAVANKGLRPQQAPGTLRTNINQSQVHSSANLAA